MFFSSHVLPEVERLSHAVAIIREGTIVAVEDIARLKSTVRARAGGDVRRAAAADLFALPGVRELHRDGNIVHLQALDGLDAAIKAMAAYRVVDLRTEQPSLEDFFLAHYAAPDGREGQRCVTG